MSNPAPTINQINAFNATQGTTIDFNIIGGTELVRSNRIYIYDLNDNSLICTHLYVSTESIHELPANTDSSIVYESGKSSADFVNGAQYYAQVQTYTDTAGTQGGSGLSVAKMFWCLVDPTLTITTIPSTISTTSYNVSATYTDTSASVVSNIIQQYQFSLYSATGSLLQSSGVVVGSGEQQGTSTAYDISYNFSGLSVGSSYYVVVDVTTTQGMNVSVQSNTFTVSIDTPTLGEATVVNNACDGYISVTSNLSGEYGGSASGEIASFVTNSINNVSSLKVSLNPVQDLHGYDKPWVGGAGKNKFNAEDSGITLNGLTRSGETFSNSLTDTRAIFLLTVQWFNGTTYVGSAVASSSAVGRQSVTCNIESAITKLRIKHNGSQRDLYLDYPFTKTGTFTVSMTIVSVDPTTVGGVVFKDIQIESGSTATSYSPYSNICPISGHTEANVAKTGKNWLPNTATSGTVANVTYTVNSDGTIIANGTSNSLSALTIGTVTLPSGTYWLTSGVVSQDNYIEFVLNGSNVNTASLQRRQFTLTQPTEITVKLYARPNRTATNLKLYPMIYLDSETDTTYEPYNGTTYTVSWQTEAGTVYGGTVDLVTGVLTVTKVLRVLNDTTKWESATGTTDFIYKVNFADRKTFPTSVVGVICSTYPISANGQNTARWRGATSDNFGIISSTFTLDDIKAQAQNGDIAICYELATPTTYQLTPTQIQTLVGVNNVWSDAGEVEVTYNIPITNLLVKRQDVADVSGAWLTLYSQPITQASDMDFTFIDFTNQYGKTYKYALVPLLTQIQSGVEVEVEGGYTVSDEVQSVFDGVFIADSTGSQKCKANVGYGNVDMNQVVGSITPIGAKYPIVITNSQNQYHNGSISGTIVPDDYYFNGNLSRIDMVNKRSELEQFLTNKRAKIIKDWNGNIWLVMIMDNVSCTFNNNYGMGIVNFSTSWVEVGDPTNQEDLQATGLINIGGV